jgi:DNA-binding HxlR family transcriptional regulator
VTPRALALALRDLEAAGLVQRDVIASHPPYAVYSATSAGRAVRRALEDDEAPTERGLSDA